MRGAEGGRAEGGISWLQGRTGRRPLLKLFAKYKYVKLDEEGNSHRILQNPKDSLLKGKWRAGLSQR